MNGEPQLFLTEKWPINYQNTIEEMSSSISAPLFSAIFWNFPCCRSKVVKYWFIVSNLMALLYSENYILLNHTNHEKISRIKMSCKSCRDLLSFSLHFTHCTCYKTSWISMNSLREDTTLLNIVSSEPAFA